MLRIAIVDDESNICSFIEKSLLKIAEKHGIDITINIFYSGEGITNELSTSYFDVIFLDIMLDNMSGLDVSGIIRNTMGNEATQIVTFPATPNMLLKFLSMIRFIFFPNH